MAKKEKKAAKQDEQPSFAAAAVHLDADFTRADFFRDLKKATRKQDRPSQRAQGKR
jgi:hypothetical protein